MMSETMYDRIRELRISMGLSQDDLARAVGYKDRSMITKIEAGKVDISQKKIVLFAKVLNTTPRFLMDGPVSETRPIWNEDIYAFLRAALQDDRYELVIHAMEVPEEDIQYADRFLGSLNKKEG